ncbi:MAG: calcium-binding protein [Sulfitobacter sp.]
MGILSPHAQTNLTTYLILQYFSDRDDPTFTTTMVDGAVHFNRMVIGDNGQAEVSGTMVLNGAGLVVTNGQLSGGTVTDIRFGFPPVDQLWGRLEEVNIVGATLQDYFNLATQNSLSALNQLLLYEIQFVRGTDADETFLNSDSYVIQSVTLMGGNDHYTHTYSGSARAMVIDGGDGFDSFLSNSQQSIYINLRSNLFIDGLGTKHSIFNFELLQGTNADDIMIASNNYGTTFFGSRGDDRMIGGAGNDNFRGGWGNDTLRGFGGDDLLLGDGDADVLDGGTGQDTVSYETYIGSSSGVYVDLDSGQTGGSGAGGDVLISIEHLIGSAANDVLRGDILANRLEGNDGNDKLEGRGGHDTLIGDNGNDTLAGGAGDDFLRGGTGQDSLDGGNGDDVLNGDAGFDLLRGGDGDDSLNGGAQADNLLGEAGNDVLFGGQGFDRLFGGTGNDNAFGGDDNDALFGESGHDRLVGDDGDDRLFGGSGNDTLFGGQGDDSLFGGGGFDILNGSTGNDTMAGNFNADIFVFTDFSGGFGVDVITDFAATNVFERIDLSNVAAITDLDDLMDNHIAQIGQDVLITAGQNSSITLMNVSLDDLDRSDFIF